MTSLVKKDITARDRINVEASKHQILKELTEVKESPFSTMKEVFMLAACVGYSNGDRASLGQKLGIFDWSVFSEEEDIPVLRALALSSDLDVDEIENQDQLLTIVEEYANSGIDVLKQEIIDKPGNFVDKVVRFFEQQLE